MSAKRTRPVIGRVRRLTLAAASAEPMRHDRTRTAVMSLDLRMPVALLSLIGVIVSAYLSAVELSQGQVPLACANSGLVNCDLVTSSAQSRLGGVPVAFLGVVWFAGMLGLLADCSRLLASPALHLAWTGGGVLMVFLSDLRRALPHWRCVRLVHRNPRARHRPLPVGGGSLATNAKLIARWL